MGKHVFSDKVSFKNPREKANESARKEIDWSYVDTERAVF